MKATKNKFILLFIHFLGCLLINSCNLITDEDGPEEVQRNILYSVNIDGSNLKQITDSVYNIIDPVYCNADDRIYFIDDYESIKYFDVKTHIVKEVIAGYSINSFTISSDGKIIVFISNYVSNIYDIFQVNSNGTSLFKIYQDNMKSRNNCNFSKYSNRVLFNESSVSDTLCYLKEYDCDTKETKILKKMKNPFLFPQYLRNDQYVLYSTYSSLEAVEINNNNKVIVIDTGAYISKPDIFYDKILYSKVNPKNKNEYYIIYESFYGTEGINYGSYLYNQYKISNDGKYYISQGFELVGIDNFSFKKIINTNLKVSNLFFSKNDSTIYFINTRDVWL